MSGEMFALVKTRPAKGLDLVKVPIPKAGYGEVLIRIRKTAICGTDLHIYNWDDWRQKEHRSPPGPSVTNTWASSRNSAKASRA